MHVHTCRHVCIYCEGLCIFLLWSLRTLQWFVNSALIHLKKIRLLSGFSEHACKGTVIMENHFNHFNVLVLYPVLLLNMERQQLNSNTVLLLWGTCLCSFISFLIWGYSLFVLNSTQSVSIRSLMICTHWQ